MQGEELRKISTKSRSKDRGGDREEQRPFLRNDAIWKRAIMRIIAII